MRADKSQVEMMYSLILGTSRGESLPANASLVVSKEARRYMLAINSCQQEQTISKHG
jgi:hypothetical protein